MSYVFNYTKRNSLTKNDIQIQMRKGEDNIECRFIFSADFLKKLEKQYAKERIYLANKQSMGFFQTFVIFKVSEIPKDWFSFDGLNNRFFTLVKTGGFQFQVVNDSALILAKMDHLIPQVEVNGAFVATRSFLALHTSDLHDKVWELDFEGDAPVLVLNDKYALHDKITSQPYKSLILGPALREMILYGVFIEKFDLQNTTVKWFRKCLSIVLGGRLEEIKIPSLQTEKEAMNYINEICDDFMNRSNLNQDFIDSVSMDE